MALNNAPTHPFSCNHTPELPELLASLKISLAISTYQAGKVILISSDGESIHMLPRNFDTPMGLTVDGNRMAVATKDEVVTLAHDPSMGSTYPKKPGVYDTLYMPRQTFYTGALSMHDMAFIGSSLWGVNTLFSCLCIIDRQYSFKPAWKPPFITELASEDRCHLNGLAVVEGKPRYVTALGMTNTAQGWRDKKLSGGMLMDVETNEAIFTDLPMPHSPRVFDSSLYMLLSATGEVARVDVEAGSFEVIQKLPGFTRGLARHGDYLFVGLSKLRKTHTFGDLELAGKKDVICGIAVLHLQTGALVGQMEFIRTCEEIYDVQVLPGLIRPGIVGPDSDVRSQGLSTPDASFWAVGGDITQK
jgi:uncharacterized protein (TIGR03032 family)